MRIVEWIAKILLVIGGINWGLVGIMEYDLVAALFGDMTTAARVVYVLVGLAALYVLIDMLAKASGQRS